MRYPDDVGYVWNTKLRVSDCMAEHLASTYDCLAAFPQLTGRPAYSPKRLTYVEGAFYEPDVGDRLMRLIDEHNIKAVMFMGCDPSSISLRKLRNRGVRTINHEQDSFPTAATQASWKRMAKALVRRGLKWNLHDLYIANAHHQRAFLLDFAMLPPERVITIVNGVDIERLNQVAKSTTPDVGLQTSEQYAVTVCQARPEKKVDFLIDVAQETFRRHPKLPLTFVHVGDGECLEQWKAKAAALGLGNRFVFAGFQNDVRPFLQRSTFLIHAAERESFGLVLAEAMACGKPVLATEAAGPREIIDDGVTGRLLRHGDVGGFADAIISLSMSQDRVHSWGAAAAERANRLFSLERQTAEMAAAVVRTIKGET